MNDQRRPRPIDASRTIIDAEPVERSGSLQHSRFRQHEMQNRRMSRLAVPDPIDRRQPARRPLPRDDYGYDDDRGYDDRDSRRDGVHVQVNNGGQYYRPWKEELLLSGFRTFGNFLAWPFRLIGGLMGSAMRFMLFAVVVPSILIGAISFYQEHRDQPAADTAREIGRSGVGIAGAALGGIWDGIFGSDDPEPAARPAADRPAGEAKAKGDENPAWEAEAKRVQSERASR